MIRVIMDDNVSGQMIHERFDEEMTLKGNISDISGGDEKQDQNPSEEAHNGGSEEARDGDINNDSLEDNNRKKRHRRKHKAGKHHSKRKWKPYDQLSWEERRELDEKESKRACVKREERFASGHALAPYNTTQFLMEDHKEIIPEGATNDNMNANKSPVKDADMSGSDEEVSGHGGSFYDSPDDEDDFLENDFSQAYKNAHADQLQAMPKSDLVRDYIELETKVERMERRLRTIEESQNNNVKNNGQILPFSSYSQDVQKDTNDEGKTVLNNKQFLSEEIKRLKQINAILQNENKLLSSNKKSSSND